MNHTGLLCASYRMTFCKKERAIVARLIGEQLNMKCSLETRPRSIYLFGVKEAAACEKNGQIRRMDNTSLAFLPLFLHMLVLSHGAGK